MLHCIVRMLSIDSRCQRHAEIKREAESELARATYSHRLIVWMRIVTTIHAVKNSDDNIMHLPN